MLTVAYCRVSTEEQAAEGFSIEAQAEKLRSYADLMELGEVLVVTDPGWSGKNLDRPGFKKSRQSARPATQTTSSCGGSTDSPATSAT